MTLTCSLEVCWICVGSLSSYPVLSKVLICPIDHFVVSTGLCVVPSALAGDHSEELSDYIPVLLKGGPIRVSALNDPIALHKNHES